ncbi:MAG: AraC family transcriptional regulator [Synergistaceae bacterium]|nr:AraC family transcriptional regulator [Synergistaceae bacterium]
MSKNSDVLIFRDYDDFFGLIAKTGEATAIPGGVAFRCDAPFASIRYETYRLFDFIDLEFFKLLPHANIDFRYELGSNHFEIGYVTEGAFRLVTENYGDSVICPAHLYIAPPSGSQGRITYYKDRRLGTLSFIAHRTGREVARDVLGENGCLLWTEAVMDGKGGRHGLYPLTTPPPDIINSLVHAANCNYPHRVRRLFFENVFREILLSLIARELPDDETSSGMNSFDAERIKSVPATLMTRLDSPPSIAELARELSINATKLQRGFKKIFGKSIYAYHRDTCLERAAIMLLDTDKSIFEIAMDAGYSGSGNFCNAFKKRYGASPGRYRQKGAACKRRLAPCGGS